MTMKELEEKALVLSCEERAQLAASLLLSLEEATESDAEKLWLDEAERRLEVHQRGAVSGIPMSTVFSEVLSDLGRGRIVKDTYDRRGE